MARTVSTDFPFGSSSGQSSVTAAHVMISIDTPGD
jgi:hypothetical protein